LQRTVNILKKYADLQQLSTFDNLVLIRSHRISINSQSALRNPWQHIPPWPKRAISRACRGLYTRWPKT